MFSLLLGDNLLEIVNEAEEHPVPDRRQSAVASPRRKTSTGIPVIYETTDEYKESSHRGSYKESE